MAGDKRAGCDPSTFNPLPVVSFMSLDACLSQALLLLSKVVLLSVNSLPPLSMSWPVLALCSCCWRFAVAAGRCCHCRSVCVCGYAKLSVTSSHSASLQRVGITQEDALAEFACSTPPKVVRGLTCSSSHTHTNTTSLQNICKVTTVRNDAQQRGTAAASPGLLGSPSCRDDSRLHQPVASIVRVTV